MDYLDPKKQSRHTVILMIGYVLVGVAIAIGTLILLYQAYGFGINKNGKVIQNGLFFFSSQPHPAQIYINGQLKSVTTNTRLSLPAGIYDVTLRRDGYRDWQRTITLDGGSVEHFDYPLLIPNTLDPGKVVAYESATHVMTQSPDRRWLLVQKPGDIRSFDIFDLKNPEQDPVKITLPDGLLTAASGAEGWQLGEWADDNRHVLLRHIYDGKVEFIMIDRTDPTQSVNLDSALNAKLRRVSLIDGKYDQYYLHDTSSKQLSRATLENPSPTDYLDHVLAYKSYGKDTVLYVTPDGAPKGKVLLKMRSGNDTSVIRSFPTHSNYLVNLTEYSGTMYVTAGASIQNKVYIYQDPVGQLADDPGSAPVPTQVLHVAKPDYLSFSDNAQFIVVEHAAEFAVYDIENEQVYHYKSPHTLDKPQRHAEWMDGDRLEFVSHGKLVIFDYDHTNGQTLVPADPRYIPAFTPDYRSVYTLSPASGHKLDLDRTWLLTPGDQ